MPAITVSDAELERLRGQVVIVTGSSSGIGLATVQELLKFGAKVVGGDLQPPKETISNPDFCFVQVDVTDWKALLNLFKQAIEKFGRVDHVYANAGIAGKMDLLTDEFDSSGDLKRPNYITVDINLISVIDTVKLGLHYIRKHPRGGSIVVIASMASFMRFANYDYGLAKHGVHGFVRGLMSEIGPGTDVPVRLNGLNPSWTDTGILSKEFAAKAGIRQQSASVPARSALLCMADESRHGQMIMTIEGKMSEIDGQLLEAAEGIIRSAPGAEGRTRTEGEDFVELRRVFMEAGAQGPAEGS